MKSIILLCIFTIASASSSLHANDVRFYGPNAVKPDAVQRAVIASSIEALIKDCTVATRIDESEVKPMVRGLEVTYPYPIDFKLEPAGYVPNIKRVVVRLWDNAEESFGMDIYAYTPTDVYLLAKYWRLGYPIVAMILNPLPPVHPEQGKQ